MTKVTTQTTTMSSTPDATNSIDLLGQPALLTAPVYLTDLSKAQPAAAISNLPRKDCWRTLPYETDTLKGVMLISGQETCAPEITLSLPVTGWHSVHIGMLVQSGPRGRVLVRMDNEACWSHLKQPATPAKSGSVPSTVIHDLYLRSCDLTDRKIVLKQFNWNTAAPGQPQARRCEPAWIAYVKLIPLSPEQVAEIQYDRKSNDSRRLWAHNDGWCYTGLVGTHSKADIQAELHPLADGDFERVYWECGYGDRMLFFDTKTHHTPDQDRQYDLSRTMERVAAQSWATLRQDKLDPLRVAAEYAHDLGVEIHATWRPGAFIFRPPYDVWNRDGFYDKHPQWRSVNRNGEPQARISFAFPQVRRYAIERLLEAASYDIDGICIAFNRRLPLVEYEQPLLDAFQKMHGKDARILGDTDPQWLQFRCSILTRFMSELRTALNQTGKKLAITAIVLATEQENISYALDVKQWIDQQLVDAIIPYSSYENDTCSTFTTWQDPKAVDWLLKLTAGTHVRVAPNMLPRHAQPSSYLSRAAGLYKQGVNELFMWDTNHRYGCTPSWSAIRRLGHRQQILDHDPQTPWPQSHGQDQIVTMLAGWDLQMMCPG